MSVYRRGFLFGAAALTAGIAQAQQAAETISLWPSAPPDGPGPAGSEIVSLNGEYRNIIQPRMDVWRPRKPNGDCVLIIGGGGYRRIAIGREAQATATWLNAIGVTAFVLYYRLPNAGWQRNAPFQDAQRAMRIIRFRATEWGLNTARIGILGFSAGGHLAGMTAVRPNAPLYAATDGTDVASAHPNFAALIYPVLTFIPPTITKVTTATLLGENATMDERQAFSVERLVTPETPPMFLVHADDDKIAPAENSLQMATALRQAKVPVALHLFQSGGHGFNIAASNREPGAWPRLFATWAGFG